ncbi:MAG: hydroxymethylglutaryl-CoA lyase [Vicinamibacterales bacterium]|nr:hydroxymethylglutaryl-CoA lyase [Vicinamibacterales bacterium]
MKPTLPARVTVVEVGPRDGLQNEGRTLSPAERARFVSLLADAGLPVIEAGAFVHPDRVPQMAGTDEVFAALARRPGTRYSALVPNVKGLERAAAAGVTEIAVFAAASDTFSRRNINQSIDESLRTYAAVCREAVGRSMRVRGYLSTCFGCPYEGPVPAARVAELSAALIDLGVFEVAVSDTIGVAHPGLVWDVLDTVARRVPLERIALHFHDTRGTGLVNVLAGLEAGITTFDASCGGLGGCPFAPGASGNLATEDLVYLLDGLGIQTGISLDGVMGASVSIEALVGHPLPSRVLAAHRRGGQAHDA